MPTAKTLLTCFALLLAAAPLGAVEGRVVTAGGRPLERAQVEVVDGGERTFTDSRGAFALPGVEPPALLLVTHPRFQDGVVELAAPPAGPLEIVLVAKQTIYEEIVVSASRGGDSDSPVSIASTVIEPGESPLPASTLAEAVARVAGVSENGQAGIFQTYSIRGIGRQRVMTLIDGMRVVGERRAGVSTSFLDPLLMGSVDLLRGPSSTWYGSGALGGVIQIFPRTFDRLSLDAGYETQGDERYQALGWGRNGWSLGVAGRRAGRAETAGGAELASGFSQYSATLAKSWSAGGRSYQLLLLPAAGRDIEKSNTDFPGRTTVYPEENHLLLRFGVATEGRWRFSAYLHPNDLVTETVRPGRSRNVVDNEALDFGWNFQREAALGEATTVRFGVDYFGRRGVTAREADFDLATGAPPTTLTTLDDAREDDAAVYGGARFGIGPAALEAGARFTWLRQQNAGTGTLERTAWSGFAGLTLPLRGGLELAANVGTGLRLPNLSERFFTGTTGRGGVIGNPDLAPERSLNADLGLRWYSPAVYVAAFVFRNEIDDYIERVEVGRDLLTFVNLTSGTLEGVEVEGFFQPREAWRLSWEAHHIEGRADDGQPLADVPAASIGVGLSHGRGPWRFAGELEWRDAKDDPGSGEMAIGSARILSAAATRTLGRGWAVTLGGGNLLDEEYFLSADDKAPPAFGRSLSLGLRFRPPPAP